MNTQTDMILIDNSYFIIPDENQSEQNQKEKSVEEKSEEFSQNFQSGVRNNYFVNSANASLSGLNDDQKEEFKDILSKEYGHMLSNLGALLFALLIIYKETGMLPTEGGMLMLLSNITEKIMADSDSGSDIEEAEYEGLEHIETYVLAEQDGPGNTNSENQEDGGDSDNTVASGKEFTGSDDITPLNENTYWNDGGDNPVSIQDGGSTTVRRGRNAQDSWW